MEFHQLRNGRGHSWKERNVQNHLQIWVLCMAVILVTDLWISIKNDFRIWCLVSFYSSLPLRVQCFFFFFFQSCPTGGVPWWNPRCGQALRSLRLHSHQVGSRPSVCGGLSHDICTILLLIPFPSPSPPQVLCILRLHLHQVRSCPCVCGALSHDINIILLLLCLWCIVLWYPHNSPAPVFVVYCPMTST